MKRTFVILMAALLMLPACTKEIRTETLKLDEEIPFHEGSDNALSLKLDIDFPVSVFTENGLEAVRRAIRIHTLGEGYAGFDASLADLGQAWRNVMAQDYILSNQEMLTTNELTEDEAPFLNWGFEINGSFGDTYKHYINYMIDQYEYQGGAHGMFGNFPLVFDLNDGSLVAWTDLAPGVSAEKMTELLSRHKLDNIKDELGDVEVDESDIFFHETIDPSAWFSVDKKGLTFYYQPYDIAPYVFGVISIPVPWKELK